MHIELPRTQDGTTAKTSRAFISKKKGIPYFVPNSDGRQLKRLAKTGKTTDI